MIHSLKIDYLEAGALPIYETGGDLREFYAVGDCHRPVVWNIHPRLRSRRVQVPLEVDIALADLEPWLRESLAAFDEDGSLIFPIRGLACIGDRLDDPTPETPNWVLAGLAFVPGVAWGTPLHGADPVSAIVEACQEVPAELREGMSEALRDAVQLRLTRREDEREARERAERLLLECLTPYQRHEWRQYGEFHVTGADGYTYVIRPGQGHNVFRVEDGVRTVEYCLVTRDFTPVADLMLAQKLLLEKDPEAFFEAANSWRLG